MNRKKWQGLTCVLLASLMMGTTFASSPRNAAPVETPKQEAPKPPEAPKPSVKPAPEAPKPVTTPPAQKVPQAETVKPSQAPKPAKEETEKKPEKKPVTEKPAAEKPAVQKPAVQKPTAETKPAPKPSCQPPKETKDKCQPKAPEKSQTEEKPEEKPTTQQPQKPACQKPSTGMQKDQKDQAQKPFSLDHFKMIVCTLKQLGMEENEIATYIKEGKKLEDILKAEKIRPKKFKKCIMKQYCKAVDEGVKEGKITKEQGKQLKAAIKETVQNWLPKK